MFKIFTSGILILIGYAFFGVAMEAESYEGRRIPLFLISAAFNAGGFILLLHGLRGFFLGELLIEIKKLTAEKK